MLIVVEYVTKVRKNSKSKLARRNSAIQNFVFGVSSVGSKKATRVTGIGGDKGRGVMGGGWGLAFLGLGGEKKTAFPFGNAAHQF